MFLKKDSTRNQYIILNVDLILWFKKIFRHRGYLTEYRDKYFDCVVSCQ